ncbi:MAG: insulinase family protein, partial [Alistipes sp.]|nr:insulinase family protein [Alistipes sp.]
RNLIGYLDGLKGFNHKDLEEFYHTWYRPEYQAVIVAGDVDVDAIEQQIASLMSDIPASPADAPQKEVIVVADNEEPIVDIYTDPEMQGSSVFVFMKRPALPVEINNTLNGEMIDVIQSYAEAMGSARLEELAMKPDAPFLSAGIGWGGVGIIPTLEATIFVAQTEDGKLAQGYEALCTEMERVRRFGFTQSEFERAQENLMRSAERKYTNRNDRRNNEFVQTYLQNYRQNKPMPDAQNEWQIDSMLIKSLTVDHVNMYVQQTIYPQNQVIFVTAPAREGLTNPTEADLLAIRDKAMTAELTAYENDVVKEPLIPETVKLKGSPVVKTAENKEYG